MLLVLDLIGFGAVVAAVAYGAPVAYGLWSLVQGMKQIDE
jgi:hypothetical protein